MSDTGQDQPRADAQRFQELEDRREVQRQRAAETGRPVDETGPGDETGPVDETGEADPQRDVQPSRVESRHDLRSGQNKATPVLRESVIVVGLALLLSLIVKTWLMQAFYIPSESMENTLLKGDRVVVNKLVPSPMALQRGDVIVFEDPDHWLPATLPVQRPPLMKAINSTLIFVGLLPSDEGNHLIKRVIGLPGDHVRCCDQNKKISVNGAEINEPYLFPGDAPSESSFNITVPPGRVWVMGDHRSDSADSRPHDEGSGGAKGSVPESLIVGRAITVVWPVDHWAWLSNPSETFARVPAAASK
jgi:signal peptidase I